MAVKLSPTEISFPQPGFTSSDGPARVLLDGEGRMVSVLESGTLQSLFQGGYRSPGGNTLPVHMAKIKFSKTYGFKPFFDLLITSPNSQFLNNVATYPINATYVRAGNAYFNQHFPVVVTESALYAGGNAQITATSSGTDIIRTFNLTIYWAIYDIPWDGIT